MKSGAVSTNVSATRTGVTSRVSVIPLLSRRENLSMAGKSSLKKLLQANRRLNTAYILKEALGRRWDHRTERGARAFLNVGKTA